MKQLSSFSKYFAISLAVVILFASCASSTLIESEPSGATIYIDGSKVGKTPYLYSDTKIVGSSTMIKLDKDGYEPFEIMLSRNETVDAGAIIGGLFVWVPFLWTMKYNPVHTYELTPTYYTPKSYDNNNSKSKTQTSTTKTTEEKLSELKKLYEKELITKEEYEKQKQRILNKN